MEHFPERSNRPTPNVPLEAPLRTRNSAPLRWRDLIITTSSITLTPLTDRHAINLFIEYTPAIADLMLARPPRTLADAFATVSRERDLMRRGVGFSLAISHRHTGEFLGVVGLHRWSRTEEPTLTIWIKSGAQQRGYGLEAVTAIRDWAFAQFDYPHLCYAVDRTNTGSIKIAESLGGKVIASGTTTTESGRPLVGFIYAIPPPDPFEALRFPPRVSSPPAPDSPR